MTELQAAVGVPQIAQVRGVVERRQALGGRLAERLAGVDGVRSHTPIAGAEHSYWLFAFEVDRWGAVDFARALRAEGVSAAPGYTGAPIYRCMSALAEGRTFGSSSYPLAVDGGGGPTTYPSGLCPVAEEALRRQITVWPHEAYTVDDIDDIDDIDDVAVAIEKVAALLPPARRQF